LKVVLKEPHTYAVPDALLAKYVLPRSETYAKKSGALILLVESLGSMIVKVPFFFNVCHSLGRWGGI
jgi:hypothetical protein